MPFSRTWCDSFLLQGVILRLCQGTFTLQMALVLPLHAHTRSRRRDGDVGQAAVIFTLPKEQPHTQFKHTISILHLHYHQANSCETGTQDRKHWLNAGF